MRAQLSDCQVRKQQCKPGSNAWRCGCSRNMLGSIRTFSPFCVNHLLVFSARSTCFQPIRSTYAAAVFNAFVVLGVFSFLMTNTLRGGRLHTNLRLYGVLNFASFSFQSAQSDGRKNPAPEREATYQKPDQTHFVRDIDSRERCQMTRSTHTRLLHEHTHARYLCQPILEHGIE
jgi:hypothetical protein